MEGYAQAAVEMAKSEYRQTLDFSADSINALDEIVVLLGESLRSTSTSNRASGAATSERCSACRYAGRWEMTQYPGGQVAVPAVDVRGSRLFPLMKVYRRLTNRRRGRSAQLLQPW